MTQGKMEYCMKVLPQISIEGLYVIACHNIQVNIIRHQRSI